MSRQGCLEGMTLAVSKLKEAVGAIKLVYSHMPALIEQEHDAIRAADLDRCEELAQKKTALGHRIDEAFAGLKAAVRDAVAVYGEATGEVVHSVDTLSEMFPFIERIVDEFRAHEQQTAVLEHLYEGLKSELEDFLQVKQETYSKIEVNRMVLSRLLANRQENYRFWQEVAADSMASYDAGGKQKAKRGGSTLTIKA